MTALDTKALLPCPFCGTAMLSHDHCFSHPYPSKGDCFLRHYSFDNRHAEAWNSRAALKGEGDA